MTLIPRAITWNILRRLLTTLVTTTAAAASKHMLKELELGVSHGGK